tara:strand:+ start:2645 stop:3091 length:447 start_codon:yes stop_codon:yes gene_type:complete
MSKKTLRINKSIIDVFETIVSENISDMLSQVAQKYGDKYGFTSKDLIDEFLPDNETLISVISDSISLKKHKAKHNKHKISLIQPKTKKCIARTWSKGKGLQCSRHALINEDFCKTHLRQFNNGSLWKGTIHDEVNMVTQGYKEYLKTK